MSANNVYRVTYHFELNGKRASETFQDNVIAADSTFGSINTVLNNNGKLQSGKSLMIEGFTHLGASFLS